MGLLQAILKIKKKRNPDNPFEVLRDLFKKVDPRSLSLSERNRLGINDTSFVYGEVLSASFKEILDLAYRPDDQVFYDLGSGSGKAILLAGLLYGWQKCAGIEYLPALHELSQTLLEQLQSSDPLSSRLRQRSQAIHFIQADYLNVDFSDADLVFINASTINPVSWHTLTEKFKQLKPKSRIIVTTRKLEPNFFSVIYEGSHEMSWGICTVFIYQKK